MRLWEKEEEERFYTPFTHSFFPTDPIDLSECSSDSILPPKTSLAYVSLGHGRESDR